MRMSSRQNEEEKVEFFLQKLRGHMLIAHKYQVEKLMREVQKYWPGLDEMGRILELVLQIPEEDEFENRKGYLRMIECLGKMI